MMEISYNLYLVGLSYTIAVFGSFTALQLAIRIPSAKGAALWGWLTTSALALGGGAIWSMHFIGMLAYGMPIEVNYDPLLTIGSLIIAVVVCAVGLFIVGRGQSSVIKLLFAGVAGGLGVCGMHYTGMAAMVMSAEKIYDPVIVGISVGIAIFAATVALWLAFNLRGSLQRFGSAFVMGIAVCGMHYTAMSGVTMTANTGLVARASGVAPDFMAFMIFAVTLALLMVLLAVAFFQTKNKLSQESIVFE